MGKDLKATCGAIFSHKGWQVYDNLPEEVGEVSTMSTFTRYLDRFMVRKVSVGYLVRVWRNAVLQYWLTQ